MIYKIIHPTVKILKGKKPDTLMADTGDILADHSGTALGAPPVDSDQEVGVIVIVTNSIIPATVNLYIGGLE